MRRGEQSRAMENIDSHVGPSTSGKAPQVPRRPELEFSPTIFYSRFTPICPLFYCGFSLQPRALWCGQENPDMHLASHRGATMRRSGPLRRAENRSASDIAQMHSGVWLQAAEFPLLIYIAFHHRAKPVCADSAFFPVAPREHAR
jgi:hypothetical protein